MQTRRLDWCVRLAARNARAARTRWTQFSKEQLKALKEITLSLGLAIERNELLLVGNNWYISHAGLLSIAHRRRCFAIKTQPALAGCDPANSRWVFKATVFKSSRCKGFTGYGDADPSNVSPLVRGAEMRVAETRAVNRALRKAYGIGICSIEEIGTFERQQSPECPVRKLPPESTNGHGSHSHAVDGNGTRVRDRLCQIIRQHNLDAELVKAYAVDFSGTKTLREASREQVEAFVVHLADWAAKDRNALLSQLNSYSRQKAGAA